MTGATVPKSEIGVVTTSSPGPTPHAATARCSAAVPDEHATACGRPYSAAISASSDRASVPNALHSTAESRTRSTAARSSSPIVLPPGSSTVGRGISRSGIGLLSFRRIRGYGLGRN